MDAKPNVYMANDWCVWIQDVDAHVVTVTKAYVDDDVQFAAVVVGPTGDTNVGGIRRPKAGPPVTFEIPIKSGSVFTFIEEFHDLKRLGDIAEFLAIHRQLALRLGTGLAAVIPKGTA